MTSARNIAMVGAAAALAASLSLTAPATADSTDGRIVFNDYGTGQLYTANPDGSSLVQVTHLPSGHFARYATWSPDSSKILFFANTNSGNRMFVMRADGTGKHLVLDEQPGYDDLQPRFEPDGRHVVFGRCAEPGCAIYSVATDGTDLHALTRYRHGVRAGADLGPAVSPDGKWIAFSRFEWKGVQAQIWLMRIGGHDAHPITPVRIAGYMPTWSADGQQIYFQGPSSGLGESVYSIRPDGTGLDKLTSTPFPNGSFNPDDSPSGKWIAFISDRTHPDLCCQDLYVMGSDGSAQQLVATGLSLPGVPSWGSAPLQHGPSFRPPALSPAQLRTGRERELRDERGAHWHDDVP